MIATTNPDRYFWKIDTFCPENRPHGYEFSIFASARFLQSVRTLGYDPIMIEHLAKGIAKGMNADPGRERMIEFNEYGICHIRWPHGSGVWLHMDQVDPDNGALLHSHNCDGPLPFAGMFAIWKAWADYVECTTFENNDASEP